MKIGRRLAIKILNASKFALSFGEAPAEAPVTEALDTAMLAELADLVDDATAAFEGYDYARALQRTEDFFWRFCDDYLELVKGRAYRDDDPTAISARVALRRAVSTVLRLFAPFLPYVTEEVWSWCQTDAGVLPDFATGSIHRSAWPVAADIDGAGDRAGAGGVVSPLLMAAEVLGRVRKAKSDAKVSMRAEVDTVTVTDTPARLAALALVTGDVSDAGKVAALVTAEAGDGAEARVDVVLAEVPAAEG